MNCGTCHTYTNRTVTYSQVDDKIAAKLCNSKLRRSEPQTRRNSFVRRCRTGFELCKKSSVSISDSWKIIRISMHVRQICIKTRCLSTFRLTALFVQMYITKIKVYFFDNDSFAVFNAYRFQSCEITPVISVKLICIYRLNIKLDIFYMSILSNIIIT